MKTILLLSFLSSLLFSSCELPKEISKIVKEYDLKDEPDFLGANLSQLCIKGIQFKDKDILWQFTLVWSQDKGPFYYLPHDDEDSSFGTAVYSVNNYGGGFLAVNNKEERIYQGIDPNRNFHDNKYSKNIFKIIDAFKEEYYPYISLHNNKDGHIGNGGTGNISMLRKNPNYKSFPVETMHKKRLGDLNDEDNLVYLAGKKIDMKKVNILNFYGINVLYEVVTKKTFDGSMSNYLIMNKNNEHYLNMETEEGNTKIQKKMIDLLISLIDVF